MIAALYALATGNYALKALCCPVVDLKQDKAGFLIIHNSTAMEAGYESYKYILTFIYKYYIHAKSDAFYEKCIIYNTIRLSIYNNFTNSSLRRVFYII